MRAATVLQAISNRSRGFTLIEVMMAILILMVGMLGLLQAINLAMEVNLRNQLREEAVNVGERVMNEMRGRGFDNISVASTPTDTYSYPVYQVPSKIRGASRSYSVTRKSTVLSSVNSLPVTKQLEILVNWTYKGITYENRVKAPISIAR
ncbi:MAG TPA: prepilin-type N-terminal cleavage/methylation domain-containing protein [Geobacteraceae bacterium]|nr:prepilin-type N-terminal cleavage/methylation domain-containing protein [Geobacteraceae bacterium]